MENFLIMRLFTRLIRWRKNSVEGNVVFIGLSFAGKTTIMNRLGTEEFHEDVQMTMGLNVNIFEYRGIKFSAFDLGGQESFQIIWEPYLRAAFAVVYVIDASTPELFFKSSKILHQALEFIPKNATLLLLANKSDIANKDILKDIIKDFEFKKMQESAILKKINVFYISAKTGDQFDNAFKWLVKSVEETLRRKSS